MTAPFDPVAARHNKGLTQRAAASEAGVPLQTIQRIEAGLGAHPKNAKKIADFYEVQVTDLPAFQTGPRVIREDYRADGVVEPNGRAA